MEAFVAVASELHFGRAAEKLHIGQPTLSDLVRRLEREMGATLLTRTTRRVELTSAGAELLERATVILGDVAAAGTAVREWAAGDVGTVRLGVMPPVDPALPRHLAAALHAEAPDVSLVVRRLWLSDLSAALVSGQIDVAITVGPMPKPMQMHSEILCGEPLLVGLRHQHPLANRDTLSLHDLADQALGSHSEALFPTWSLAVKGALHAAGVNPPVVELADADLSASKWQQQRDVDWILTTASATIPGLTALIPVTPAQLVPVVLHWPSGRVLDAAVRRFVQISQSADLPEGCLKPRSRIHSRAS